ncbi:MAG: carboxypeptidase regulatory-like domain-containing protein, partial [Panacagrimonas sp.]
VVNSDPTLHNVHALPKVNAEFNFGQPIKGMRSRRTFAKPEVMVPIRCDVHSWMSAYAGVLPHSFFAVTSADGSFEIKALPPGTYVIEAWHERLGTRTQEVAVDDRKGATAAFSFTAKS